MKQGNTISGYAIISSIVFVSPYLSVPLPYYNPSYRIAQQRDEESPDSAGQPTG